MSFVAGSVTRLTARHLNYPRQLIMANELWYLGDGFKASFGGHPGAEF